LVEWDGWWQALALPADLPDVIEVTLKRAPELVPLLLPLYCVVDEAFMGWMRLAASAADSGCLC
jgi:hypothetical protein